MKNRYSCFICNRKNVKLWRPYGDTNPLVCATCAEERQSPYEYDELIWMKENGCYIGKSSGKKLLLPKWKVDENGSVPSYFGPVPEGMEQTTTYILIVDLKYDFKGYSSGRTELVPAIINENGKYWCYTVVPEERIDFWRALATR